MRSLAWTIELSEPAIKALLKLDKGVQRQIRSTLTNIANLDDHRTRGKALSGNLRGLWRYRVGDYRIICRLKDDALIIVVIDLGHRARIYD